MKCKLLDSRMTDVHLARRVIHLLVTLSVLMISASVATGQPATIPAETVPYALSSGVHDGRGIPEALVAFRETVHVPGAGWLRLAFKDYSLGNASLITIRSITDGARQHLDARSITDWGGTTAFFNGDAVEIELVVAPDDHGVFFDLKEAFVGRGPSGPSPILSLCGTDDRASIDDPRVGRFCPPNGTTGWCTAFLMQNGALATAWHCFNNFPANGVVEYNVPASNQDGTVVHPGPEDQYPIDMDGRVTGGGPEGTAHDWAVFRCRRNSETNLYPLDAQAAFCRVTHDNGSPTAYVPGYGDDCPYPPGQCQAGPTNDTLRGAAGTFLGEHDDGNGLYTIRYVVDTMGGESGSPVYMQYSAAMTMGIHTYGACPQWGYNLGTGFETGEVRAGINSFSPPSYLFVDTAHESPNEDGSVFRPYANVSTAVAVSAPGDTLCVAGGNYPGSLDITSGPITLIAKAGTVTIGQ